MVYPNFSNKHLYGATVNPSDFAKSKRPRIKLPKKYIILYPFGWMKNGITRKYKPKVVHIYPLLDILIYKDIGFVIMTGVGSPHAAGIIEELIALGGREFLNFGSAGGLNGDGIFVCTKALRDEGTSHHYLPSGKFVEPDKELTERLKKSFKDNKLDFKEGISWTIDAPYRETEKEVKHYSKLGISTVEMEASALFAVAKYRKVKIASAFAVSDFPGSKKHSKYHRFDTQKAQKKMIEVGVKCFMEK